VCADAPLQGVCPLREHTVHQQVHISGKGSVADKAPLSLLTPPLYEHVLLLYPASFSLYYLSRPGVQSVEVLQTYMPNEKQEVGEI